MEICRKMAGYSYGRADLVRRAMAKKKHDVMEKERDIFIAGAVKNNVPEKVAQDVFSEMAGFASYAFNKSHAAAYSVVAYRTAYLKCHFYKEYMAALMSAFTEYTGKLMEYISECGRHGVKILRPDINESDMGFTAAEEGIRFSLLAAKNLGRGMISEIIEEREKNGRYVSLTDLVKRMNGHDFSRRCAESLIKCGALDGFALNRRQMLENYDLIANACADYSRGTIEGQLDFFGMSDSGSSAADIESTLPKSDEFGSSELLEMEKEILGIYISGHPLKNMRTLAQAMRLPDIASAMKLKEGTKAAFVCTLTGVKKHAAKSGEMAFLSVEDMSGECECVVFPSVYVTAKPLLESGRRVYIEGRLSPSRDGGMNILADRILSEEDFNKKVCGGKLFIRCKSTDRDIISACTDILRKHQGSSPVLFRFSDISRTIAHREIKTCGISAELIEELSEAAGTENTALSVVI